MPHLRGFHITFQGTIEEDGLTDEELSTLIRQSFIVDAADQITVVSREVMHSGDFVKHLEMFEDED